MDKGIDYKITIQSIEDFCERHLKCTDYQEQIRLIDIVNKVEAYIAFGGCLWDLRKSKALKKVISHNKSCLNKLEGILNA